MSIKYNYINNNDNDNDNNDNDNDNSYKINFRNTVTVIINMSKNTEQRFGVILATFILILI